mmetsp:Transcript_811/g.1795  ORF Transcript_811/g.1795 Transcript_811/m.1795 type:complete len:241 (+) Transcript_811:480-1202(+)
MHLVTVDESIYEQVCDRIDVITALLSNVFEQKTQRLQHTVLHIHVLYTVLVEQRRKHGEGSTRLRHDGDGNRSANAILALLHLEIVEQSHKHILWAHRPRDVPKCIHRCASNRLLVRLKHIQHLKANAHPFLGGNVLRATIRNAPNQVNQRFLHILLPVPQDRCKARQEVLDRRCHLADADVRHNCRERAEDAREHLGVLLTQILVQDHAEVPHEPFLTAILEHWCNLRNEVRSLLPRAR